MENSLLPKDVDRPSIFLVPRLPSPLVSPFCARVQISQDPLCVGFTPNEKLEVCEQATKSDAALHLKLVRYCTSLTSQSLSNRNTLTVLSQDPDTRLLPSNSILQSAPVHTVTKLNT